MLLTQAEDENVGMHVVHTGGEYVSCLVLPFIQGIVLMESMA